MRRALTPLLLAIALLGLGAGAAQATVFEQTEWDVSLAGKQTVKWSFSAESPEECVAYYGSPSHSVRGSGAISMSFATKKKQPIWAETYLSGKKLQFSSFSTGGWSAPAVFSKQGKFSMSSGMPCGSDPGDPMPLPTIADDTGCGTQKAILGPSLQWSKGELVLLGSLDVYPERCPGVFEQGMLVDPELASCTPKDQASGLEGTTLQELHVDVPSTEFLKGKAFTASANHKFRCEFPSRWTGEPPLKVELSTRYDIAFKPRRH